MLILLLGAGLIDLYIKNNRLAGDIGRLPKSIPREPVVVFYVQPQNNDFKIKPFICPVTSQGDRHLQALQMVLNGPAPETGLMKLFPEGTQALGLTVQNGLATVNLNRQAMQLNAGSSLEALAVASIVNTLTKFPDVYRVKIVIEGKEVESLAGHVDLSMELQYTNYGVDPVPETLK
jgi:spore germination protein GerM